jgi:hypothetical protein
MIMTHKGLENEIKKLKHITCGGILYGTNKNCIRNLEVAVT